MRPHLVLIFNKVQDGVRLSGDENCHMQTGAGKKRQKCRRKLQAINTDEVINVAHMAASKHRYRDRVQQKRARAKNEQKEKRKQELPAQYHSGVPQGLGLSTPHRPPENRWMNLTGPGNSTVLLPFLPSNRDGERQGRQNWSQSQLSLA